MKNIELKQIITMFAPIMFVASLMFVNSYRSDDLRAQLYRECLAANKALAEKYIAVGMHGSYTNFQTCYAR